MAEDGTLMLLCVSQSHLENDVSDVLNIQTDIVLRVQWSRSNRYVEPVSCYGSFILIVPTPDDHRGVRFQPSDLKKMSI